MSERASDQSVQKDQNPIADRIMLGIIAVTEDGGRLDIYMDKHNITFVRAGAGGDTGYITALPRSAFMLAAMTLAKEIESRVDDFCNDDPESLDDLAGDLLVTHAEAAAAYPLSKNGDAKRDAGTCVSEVAMYGVRSIATATCLDNPERLDEMLKLKHPSEGGGR